MWARMMPEAPALRAATKISLGSAIVAVMPPEESSKIPSTACARLVKRTLNCSMSSIFEGSQDCVRTVAASFEQVIFGRCEGLTRDE